MLASRCLPAPLFALAAIVSVPAAHAAEVKVSGTAAHVIITKDTEKLADGRTLVRVHDKGTVQADDPKSPLNLAARDCYGTMILDAAGNFADGGGFCQTIDKDHDTYWNTWNPSPKGPQWTVYHGAGKYEGMTGGGYMKFLVDDGDRYIISYEGTVTMK